jgi:hypothetical protein
MKRIAWLTISLLFAIGCSARSSDPATTAASSSAPNSQSTKLDWARYDDPAEHAFSLEAPQGWDVQGGMFRFGYFDVRWMMDVRSPDGKIILRIDDANIPSYAIPGPHTPPEGKAFNKPRQFQMVVANYRPGQAYAENYSQTRFKGVCKSISPHAAGWKPVIPAIFRDTPPKTESEGSVSYDCETSAGPRTALFYARTSSYGVPNGGGFWQADPVISILATSDSLAFAESVAQHMLDTLTKSPQWVEYQARMQRAGAAEIQRDFQQFMSQMQAYHQARTTAWNNQVAKFEAGQNARQAQSTNWGNILTGLTDAVDPQTGNRFQVWTGPYANYYRNGLGQTVNANTSPGSAYHQIETPPPPQ